MDAGPPYYLDCVTDLTDPNYGNCVECAASSECTPDICDPFSGLCDNVDPDCRTDGGTDCSSFDELCDPATGSCVACLTSADCQDAGPASYCDPGSKQCGCATAADCVTTAPGCYRGACGQCGYSGDCPTGMTCDAGACG